MKSKNEIVKIFSEITDENEMARFFEEILTPREVEAISLRWQLLKELYSGETQRSIAARHRISLCKITRGSKILKNRESLINKILQQYYGEKNE